jgi:hypothetical protein
MKTTLTLAAIALLASAHADANPFRDNWKCGAMLRLQAMTAQVTSEDVKQAEACASEYLTWATSYGAKHPTVMEAVKARQVAFLAYARALAVPQGLDVRALKTKLEEADARVEVEAQVTSHAN